MGELTVGRGVDEHVHVGPLIDGAARNRVSGLVDEALSLGARALTGAKARSGRGYFDKPTVLADVPADAAVAREDQVTRSVRSAINVISAANAPPRAT